MTMFSLIEERRRSIPHTQMYFNYSTMNNLYDGSERIYIRLQFYISCYFGTGIQVLFMNYFILESTMARYPIYFMQNYTISNNFIRIDQNI